VAVDDEAGQAIQYRAALAKRRDRRLRIAQQPPRRFPRAVEAEQPHVGRLARGRVLARGLAELLRAFRGVEDVVHDLEGEADGVSEPPEPPKVLFARAPEDTTAHDASAEQCARLRAMQALQVGDRHVFAPLRFEVRDLAADEAGRPRRRAQDAGRPQSPRRAVAGDVTRARLHEDVERAREQRVAGQDRDGLAEDLVRRRLAAAQVVVVHGGQVVVDQAVRVDHLDGAGQRHQRVFGAAHRLARGQDEEGANALAAREKAVADGAVDGGRPIRLRGQGGIERGLDPPPPRLEPGGEVSAQRLTRCRP